jgi:hypothetical protein
MDQEDRIHGGAIEYCDGLDNDCDNQTDEECTLGKNTTNCPLDCTY